MRSFGRFCVAALLLVACAAPAAAQTTSPQKLFEEALEREATLRKEIESRKAGSAAMPLLDRARILAQTFEDIARLFPRSSQSDDSLWQGAMLAADIYREFRQVSDRARALRLFKALETRYPASPHVKKIAAQTARLNATPAAPANAATAPRDSQPAPQARPAAPAPAAQAVTQPQPVTATPPAQPTPQPQPVPAATPAPRPQPAPPAPSALKAIRREVLPAAIRITLELEREAQFYDERLEGPPRVYVDLYNTSTVEALKDKLLTFPDDVVRHVRIGRHEDGRTRVVLDLDEAGRHSVYPLYNPYRIVIDVERKTPLASDVRLASTAPPATAPATPVATAPVVLAAPPSNYDRAFSLSRQLGLGVSRIVIDPGHGGHDPGAKVRGLTEAELTLDIALRLEKLLKKQRGVEVVLTRRTNTYVPLEERTAIANRAGADLFLSIHTNASADARARGIETYFLNFASSASAEAVAARENASSNRTMSELPDIVKTIALNNKFDESRDFAEVLQQSMYDRLRRVNRNIRNLGVKQAPFVVLIGATMPSVLAEISFLTNRQEAALLRTPKYRQQIAEALLAGVMKYQESLKSAGTVATQ